MTLASGNIKSLHKDLAKLLMEGFKDPACNVSELVLDFYHETVKVVNENNTDIYYLENQAKPSSLLKTEHSNFLALYSAVLNGLFEDNGIAIQNYGTLFVKSINIISKYIDGTFGQVFMEYLDQLFTVPKEAISLIDMSYLYSLKDLNAFKQAAEDKNTWFPPPINVTMNVSLQSCIEKHMQAMNLNYKTENGFFFDEMEPENNYENFSSPCKELNEHQICSDYCKWHKDFFNKWKQEDFLTLMKYGVPQRSIFLNPSTPDKEQDLAKKLFETGNVKKLDPALAPKSPVIFCHNKREGFLGHDAGMSSKFCDDFYPMPTDIGLCLTRNLDIKEVLHENKHFKPLYESNLQSSPDHIQGGTLWGDMTLVLLTDSTNYLKGSYLTKSNAKLNQLKFQLHQSDQLGKFMKEKNFEKELASLTLEANNEYFIDVTPTGKISSQEIKDLDFKDRKCNSEEDSIKSKSFKNGKEHNCLNDCLVSLAKEQCNCLPWDFIASAHDNDEECDIFGRECFFNTLEYFNDHSNRKCSHCKKDCDYINYPRVLVKKQELADKGGYFPFQGKYISVFYHGGTSTGTGTGNVEATKGFKDFIEDTNSTLTAERGVIEDLIKDLYSRKYFEFAESNSKTGFGHKHLTMYRDMIVVHLRFLPPRMNMVDVKYTLMDQFASFGGKFGIFAQLTGCSFLGLINILFMMMKNFAKRD